MLTVEEMGAEGGQVAVRYPERGTFLNPCRGQPPTGTSCALIAPEWRVVWEGSMQRRWGARDAASHARPIGFVLG
jgi:hypothetical protein